MKISIYLITILILLPTQAMAQLNIVATTPALAQIAKAVCGNDGKVRSLAKVGQDPHFVPAKPTLARYLAQADVLFTVGLALESGWLPPLIALSRNPHITVGAKGYIAGSDYISVIGGGGKVDRSMGDVHPEGNPHWWLDPLRVATVAQQLALRLGTLDPEHAQAYSKRAGVFSAQLQQLVKRWKKAFKSPLVVVTYHDSYRYLVDLFGIQVLGFIEPKPGVEASTRHLDTLVVSMQKRGVQQIWSEPYHLGRMLKQVASVAQASVITMPDSIEGEAGEAYLEMINGMLKQAAGAQ